VNIDPTILAIIVGVIVVVAIAAIWAMSRRKAALRERFGPEYDRAVRERGSERAAQNALAEREKRVDKFKIRDLDPTEREGFEQRWHGVQSRFVDDPKGAVIEADDNVQLLMATRGYPMSDFDQRAADLSVDHPRVVEHYRLAHNISLRHRRGEASTEDLRQAMIHYRSLFEELLNGRRPSDRKVA
jgi:hypothetical protein